MRFSAQIRSFRARLLLLLALMLGLTLGIQYYFNLRTVRANARMIVEQEQAIMSGIALGIESLQSDQYLDEIIAKLLRVGELDMHLNLDEKCSCVVRHAAAIAHEIRNPLNYINLTLDHLRSSFGPADPKKRETFVRLTDQLKTEVARINRHISDFLKYSLSL